MTSSVKKISSTHYAQATKGAEFGIFDGWRIAQRFQAAGVEVDAMSKGVGLADVSYIQKFDLKADTSDARIPDGLQAYTRRLARRHWLAASRWDESGRLSIPDSAGNISITDVSSVYTALLLIGQQSRAVLQKLSSLNVSDTAMRNQTTAQASLAQIHCIVTREDIGNKTAFQLLIGREYGEYAWNTLMDAGAEFGIVPVGIEALKKLKD